MPDDLLDLLRRRGPLRGRELAAGLGVSQPTLSRLTARAGRALVRIGRARATRYAALRQVGDDGNTWPTYRVDAAGRPQIAGHLHALAPSGYWYEAPGPAPAWLAGEFSDGLFPGLPWFLEDARPQGFLGRAFARRHASELGVPPDPQRWSADQVLRVLLRFGSDLPGDFLIGDVAVEQFHRGNGQAPIAAVDRAECYDALADAAIAGDLPGSSAGGEQPKFTATVEDSSGARHLLVKFSPPRDSPAGRRWSDLLLCEHLAAQTLAAHGLAACETVWFESSLRGYLEVVRFDRTGGRGRHGVVSLIALDAAHRGQLDNWYAAADWLQRDDWLGAEDADHLRTLWWFGRFIGNTDMHFGNVSFRLDHSRPLRMLPAYDMLPMHYRPAVSGEVTMPALSLPFPPPPQQAIAERAAEIACAFWRAVAADRRTSAEFRSAASHGGDEVSRTMERVRSPSTKPSANLLSGLE